MTRHLGRAVPQDWWPTVYIDHEYHLPELPTQYDAAAGGFASRVVENLLDWMPTDSPAGDYSAGAVMIGDGVATHNLEEDWPRVLPCVTIDSPIDAEADPLKHYRFSPKEFDIEQGWLRVDRTAEKLALLVREFRRMVHGRGAPHVSFSNTAQLLEDNGYTLTYASSFNLARVVSAVAGRVVADECALLDMPEDCVPQVMQSGMEVRYERAHIQARRREPCL